MSFHAIRKEVIDEWDKAIKESKDIGKVVGAIFTRLESIEHRLSYLEQGQVRDK